MTDWLSGTLPPESTTTTTTTKEAPQFYTNYLQDLATQGMAAVNTGGVAGFSPLQQASFAAAPSLAFSGSNTAGTAAANAATGAGPAYTGIQNYMNPYTSAVVDEMGRLQQRAIQESIMPNLMGQFAGTGGFGSRRQAFAAGQTLRDLQADLLGKQTSALQSGYDKSLAASQADLDRAIQASQAGTSAARAQYDIGTGGLKTLQDLGKIQQGQEQAVLDYPMKALERYSQLLSPYATTIPTTVTEQSTGVKSGVDYGPSRASQLASLLTGLGALMRGGTGAAAGTTGGGATGGGAGDILGGLSQVIPQDVRDWLSNALGGL